MNSNNNNNTSNLPTNLTGSDLIDAKLEEHQVCGSKQCPECGHKLEGKPDWLGLPAGVKFDPTDQELIEHLEAKVEAKDMKPHPLIDEFIPTIEGEDGICYTHPEKLPGVTRDGQNRHFFHRPSKAYTTGTRKRRKIQTETDLQGGETRWHKTGKTRPVMANGTQKGCKKILVLYTNFGKNRKPEKTNWVMHQYHLGQHEEEKEGELVVSKIFYQTQPRQCNWSDRSVGTTTVVVGEGSAGPTDPNFARRSNLNISQGNEINISSYNPSIVVDIQQLNKSSEQFGFAPYRKNFDEVDSIISFSQATSSKVAIGGETNSTVREAPSASICETDPYQRLSVAGHHHHLPPHSHHQIGGGAAATAASSFHISRPSSSISSIIAPTPLHHTSSIINLDQHDSFHQVSTLMLHNEFQQHQQQQQQQHQQQQQQQQQQHHKLGGRVASGLEEIIMSCTSSESNKAETSMQPIKNPQSQEPEWLKYSSYWPDPDNPDHHG